MGGGVPEDKFRWEQMENERFLRARRSMFFLHYISLRFFLFILHVFPRAARDDASVRTRPSPVPRARPAAAARPWDPPLIDAEHAVNGPPFSSCS